MSYRASTAVHPGQNVPHLRFSRFSSSDDNGAVVRFVLIRQPKVQNVVSGKLEESASAEWIDVRNPATQVVVCRVPCSTQEEVREVASANGASPTPLPRSLRCRCYRPRGCCERSALATLGSLRIWQAVSALGSVHYMSSTIVQMDGWIGSMASRCLIIVVLRRNEQRTGEYPVCLSLYMVYLYVSFEALANNPTALWPCYNSLVGLHPL